MKDLYEKFAYDYDEFGAIEEYLGAERAFFETLFKDYGTKSVLDCSCGTGQHLYMFSQMGLKLQGSDYSNAMVDVACKNLKKNNVDIPLCQCDFRYLEQKINDKFDAVICLTNSLPHLHSEEDLLTAFVSMKNRLNPNGIVVFTQGTTHHTLTLPSIEVAVNREDFSRVFVKEHDDTFQTIHVLDLFHSENRMESNQYDIKYRIILNEDYQRLLTKAGFRNIKVFGDYEMNEYNEKSWRLIVVAQCP